MWLLNTGYKDTIASSIAPSYITGYGNLLDVVRQNEGPYHYEPPSHTKVMNNYATYSLASANNPEFNSRSCLKFLILRALRILVPLL